MFQVVSCFCRCFCFISASQLFTKKIFLSQVNRFTKTIKYPKKLQHARQYIPSSLFIPSLTSVQDIHLNKTVYVFSPFKFYLSFFFMFRKFFVVFCCFCLSFLFQFHLLLISIQNFHINVIIYSDSQNVPDSHFNINIFFVYSL